MKTNENINKALAKRSVESLFRCEIITSECCTSLWENGYYTFEDLHSATYFELTRVPNMRFNLSNILKFLAKYDSVNFSTSTLGSTYSLYKHAIKLPYDKYLKVYQTGDVTTVN